MSTTTTIITPVLEKKEKLPVAVNKPIPLTFDLGHLTCFDSNPLDPTQYSPSNNDFLISTVRDGAQALINQILTALPIKRTPDGIFVELLDPITPLPREKPVPKEKEMTKWEAFALKKGITPKGREERSKLVYDEEKGEWVPRWGYKGANKDTEKQWLVEVDDKKASTNANEEIDPRKMSREARKKAVKINERQMKKNVKHAVLGPKSSSSIGKKWTAGKGGKSGRK